MDLTALQLNKYQTKYTAELLQTLPDIVVQWLDEAISNHVFIQRLISKDRPYAKDCERDKKGRAKLDLTNPYILTDTGYFTKTADFYRKNGCYTFIKPNPNPNSEYKRFWRQEIRRCWDGMLRPKDGAYITGLEYFYLNFYRMLVAKISDGTKRAKRVFDFPAFYELAHYRYRYIEYALEAGLNAIELSKRGSGKSYSIASILAHNLILGIDSEQRNGTVGGFIASDKTYLDTKKDGTLKKFVDELAFLRRNTEFPRLMTSQSGNEMAWKKGYKDASGGESEESSIVFGTSVADDSDKLRGKRGWFMYEEIGNFPNLYETYAANLRGASEGDYSIGLIYLIGTANNKESNFESAKTLLYKPKEHSIFSLPNVYDEEKKGRDEFGLFTPAFLNRLGCYNKDGISDVTKALLQIMLARYKAYQSGEAFALLHAIAEDPIDPTEAMIQSRSAYFPVTQLNERLTWLNTHPEELNQHYIGTLAMNGDGEVVFKPTKDIPLRHWNRSKENKQNENLEGALEIFQMPQKSPRTGKIIEDRYLCAADPIDQEQGESSSLFSVMVFDRMTNRIVAEYTGRKQFSDENYEIVRLLCFFYDARCLYENNIHGMYNYFKQFNCTYLLYDCPDYLKQTDKVKYNGVGVTVKGVRRTRPIIELQMKLIRDWLLSSEEMNVVDDNGEEKVVSQPMLYTIDSPALLEELIGYYDQANVDRISALGMIMLIRESYKEMGVDTVHDDSEREANEFYSSDFFDKMYVKKKSNARYPLNQSV